MSRKRKGGVILTFSADEIREKLQASCTLAGSQAEFAKRHNLSAKLVSDVLAKRREPGKSIAAALGFRRYAGYVPIGNFAD